MGICDMFLLTPSTPLTALRLLCLVSCLALPSVALGIDPASQLLREQQSDFRTLEQQQRLKRWQQREQTAPTSETEASADVDGACWPFPGLRLSGNQVVSSAALEAAIQPILRPCMGVADINRLLVAITRRYVEAGYPAARPYLASTPHQGEPLQVVIVEGFVESIALADPSLPLSLRGAFPGMLGEPLRLPDLEQGLDQLNRLQAFTLSADLLPGDLPGGSRLVLQPQHVGRRWRLSGTLDNRASQTVGRHRLGLRLGLDSPARLNDALSVSLSTALPGAAGQSQAVALHYSVPYGPWTLGAMVSRLTYRATPRTPGRPEGESRFQGLNVNRMLWRNQQGLLSASVRLDQKHTLNRLYARKTLLQSTRLTTLEAGLDLLWLHEGLWNVSLGVSQGLPFLGADTLPLSRQAPRPDFRKYRASLLHLRQGRRPADWHWQSLVSLQYSADRLPALEQLALSDDLAVRGFRQHYVAGATGALWRNTFSHPLWQPDVAGVDLRASAGLDLGWSRYAQGEPSQRLVGGALGLHLNLPHARLRLDHQRALSAHGPRRSRLEPGFWVAELSIDL
ncbi:ShlB/FhaC/HecB family hemolysin secretion/activation protein [Enterobacterales bacterium AW_CKDN230030176-1A_HGKHYDSX7]